MRLLQLCILAMAGSSFAVAACDTFQEPDVSFAGIATEQQLAEYRKQLVEEAFRSSDRVSECWEAEIDAAERAGSYRRKDALMDSYLVEAKNVDAARNRFLRQFDQAGKAHLAGLSEQHQAPPAAPSRSSAPATKRSPSASGGPERTIVQTFVNNESIRNDEQAAIDPIRRMPGKSCRVLSVGPQGSEWVTLEVRGGDVYPNGVCKSGHMISPHVARVASGDPSYKWVGAWTKCINACSWHANGQLAQGMTARSWPDIAPGRVNVPAARWEVILDENGNLTSYRQY